MSDDKTEEPTQKKIDDARKEGNVWKSRDLSGAISFVVAMSVVKATWGDFETSVRHLFSFAFEQMSRPETLSLATSQLMTMALTQVLVLCLPIALAAAVTGGMVDFLQVGPLLALKAVMPKLEKLNAIEGLKNLVGKKQLIEMVKSIAKLSVTGYVTFGVVRDAMGLVVATIRGDPSMTMLVMGELVSRVVIKVTLLFVVFAIFDVWWQRHSYMKDQMMSKDDIKKEYKESEGDPHHKAKRKELHQEIMEGEQMAAVESADVVVTNPDHVAVALKYDKANDGAPRVVAKGIDGRAQAIKALAKDADVPMLRNIPLAHALHRVDVNAEIPEALYDAVAEVLNFVWQLKAQTDEKAPGARV
ncbi:MAG: type III secretion system export apparatus subunit SctU [Archangium sp.]|nr:type III secretion system export apparatus subunit SctU [Archangium sp.]